MEELKEARDLKKEVEAILFAAGRKVGLEEISELLKEKNVNGIKSAIAELKREYDESDSPMFVIEEGDGWKMTVKEKYLGVVKDVAPHTELNKALLETLAIVAWKQPILQADVIRLRGSSAYEHLRDLVEMGFITKVKYGRSFVIKPSTRFFDYFDLPSKEAAKEIFKDVEFTDLQKRKEIGEPLGEKQQKIGDMNVNQKPEGTSEEDIENAEHQMETEKFGKLEVFEEPEDNDSSDEVEQPEAPEEEPADEEEKTEKIIEELTEPEEKEDAEPEKEAPERRVSKELEEFAGIDSDDKENKETDSDGEEDNPPRVNEE